MTNNDIKYLDANNAKELLRAHMQTMKYRKSKTQEAEPVWLVSDAQKAQT
jgi:hypothetical protein